MTLQSPQVQSSLAAWHVWLLNSAFIMDAEAAHDWSASVGEGATAGAERRRAIYQICQQHDIIILEDDPYYYLQFNAVPGDAPPLAY